MNLTHHFLIAMPGLEDASFARSVVYLCEHSERGALGLIINKPSDISLKGLFDKVDLSLRRADLSQEPVFQGGPVQTERGFVLHEPMLTDSVDTDESAYASTMTIPGGLEMTTSRTCSRPCPPAPARAGCWSPWATRPGARGSSNPNWPRTAG